jgi:hypothetical protein
LPYRLGFVENQMVLLVTCNGWTQSFKHGSEKLSSIVPRFNRPAQVYITLTSIYLTAETLTLTLINIHPRSVVIAWNRNHSYAIRKAITIIAGNCEQAFLGVHHRSGIKDDWWRHTAID